MKKAELQEIVPELLDFFNDYIYHQFEISAEGIPTNADEYRITPEHIRLLADSGEKRTACFAELGLEPFEHTRTTRGETISSSDKTSFLILMFYRKIKDENEFARVLFHEAGHAISAISSPDYAKVSDAIKIDSEEIKTVKLGAMIWSECIAETIANRAYEEYITQKETQDGVAPGSYLYRHKFIVQDMAFSLFGQSFLSNGTIDYYTLGMYIAYLLTDPSLEAMREVTSEMALGFDTFNKETAEDFAKLTRFCDHKLYALEKENANNDSENYGAYWNVDAKWLYDLGALAETVENDWGYAAAIAMLKKLRGKKS